MVTLIPCCLVAELYPQCSTATATHMENATSAYDLFNFVSLKIPQNALHMRYA